MAPRRPTWAAWVVGVLLIGLCKTIGSSHQGIRASLRAFTGQHIGFDLVEVAPPIDPTGLSPVVAAEILRDTVLAWAR